MQNLRDPHLRDRVALVTGAAQGIGAETAQKLAEEGARLILVDVDAESLHAVAESLGDENVIAVVADVRDLSTMQAAVDAGLAKFGRLDFVVANAGICSYGTIMTVDPAAFQQVIDINLVGVFHTVRASLPALTESRGYILIVSSVAAYLSGAGMSAYSASKAGVEHFATALRLEVASRGVDVGSAHMSWIDTPLLQDAKRDLPGFQQILDVLPGPLRKTISVGTCADCFVRGLVLRKRRVNVPRWIGAIGWLKPVVTSRIGDRTVLASLSRTLPLIDAEVAQLGRSTSSRYARSTAVEPT